MSTPGARRDKFIVDHASYRGDVDWGKVNRPIAAEAFDILHQRAAAYLQGREVFVQDCYAGADLAFRLPIRVITETAWHNLFARNMFIQPPAANWPLRAGVHHHSGAGPGSPRR